MKAEQVQIGAVYLAQVSGRVVPVKVLRQDTRSTFQFSRFGPGRYVERTTWVARNEATGREITIRSPQRLRRLAPTGGAQS